MTTDRRASLRCLMLIAWDFKRAEPTRLFADCLRGAWKVTMKLARGVRRLLAQAKASGGYVQLSPDLTRSPTKRKLIGQRYAGARAYNACKGRGAFGL